MYFFFSLAPSSRYADSFDFWVYFYRWIFVRETLPVVGLGVHSTSGQMLASPSIHLHFPSDGQVAYCVNLPFFFSLSRSCCDTNPTKDSHDDLTGSCPQVLNDFVKVLPGVAVGDTSLS